MSKRNCVFQFITAGGLALGAVEYKSKSLVSLKLNCVVFFDIVTCRLLY